MWRVPLDNMCSISRDFLSQRLGVRKTPVCAEPNSRPAHYLSRSRDSFLQATLTDLGGDYSLFDKTDDMSGPLLLVGEDSGPLPGAPVQGPTMSKGPLSGAHHEQGHPFSGPLLLAGP